jgi:hypothetical protein
MHPRKTITGDPAMRRGRRAWWAAEWSCAWRMHYSFALDEIRMCIAWQNRTKERHTASSSTMQTRCACSPSESFNCPPDPYKLVRDTPLACPAKRIRRVCVTFEGSEWFISHLGGRGRLTSLQPSPAHHRIGGVEPESLFPGRAARCPAGNRKAPAYRQQKARSAVCAAS